MLARRINSSQNALYYLWPRTSKALIEKKVHFVVHQWLAWRIKDNRHTTLQSTENTLLVIVEGAFGPTILKWLSYWSEDFLDCTSN